MTSTECCRLLEYIFLHLSILVFFRDILYWRNPFIYCFIFLWDRFISLQHSRMIHSIVADIYLHVVILFMLILGWVRNPLICFITFRVYNSRIRTSVPLLLLRVYLCMILYIHEFVGMQVCTFMSSKRFSKRTLPLTEQLLTLSLYIWGGMSLLVTLVWHWWFLGLFLF